MPTPVHARLRIGGSLYSDAQWSIGVNFGSAQSGDPFANLSRDVPGALETWADNVRGLNNQAVFPAAWLEVMGQYASIEYVRASRVGTDGKESDVALINLSPVVKGSSTASLPAQLALAVSLTTGRPGGSYRGRLYLPACGVNLTQGRVPAGTTAAVASQGGQWLADVGTAGEDFGGTTSIKAMVVSTTRGVLTRVTGTRVGNRLDSQRRRSEGQEEVYGVAAVPQ